MGLSKEEIAKRKKEINKQHNDFIVEFREKIGYHPKKYRSKTNKNLDLEIESMKERINKKQKDQVDGILNWCLDVYPEEINNTGFFLDVGNLRDFSFFPFYFGIPIDYEEKLFRLVKNKHDFNRIKSVLKNVKIDNIDDSLKNLIDIRYERNFSRFSLRFTQLFVKLIQRPFIQIFYKQFDKKAKEEIIGLLRKNNPNSKDKSDYELFYYYVVSYF